MKLTITAKDRSKAGDYYDNSNCLVATMLKRRGYEDVSVMAFHARTATKKFSIQDYFAVLHSYGPGRTKVKKSAIGKKIELVEVRA